MIEFKPRADCKYKYNYEDIFREIAENPELALPLQKSLILDDLFFIVNFIMEIPEANRPFVVDACKEVEKKLDDWNVYLWARYHFKSSIITKAATIQRALEYPNQCTMIASHTRPIARKFLRSIMRLFETNQVLKDCFPDVLYNNPQTESPKWSENDGIVVKRSNVSRSEATVEAWGIKEGMPISVHFEKIKLDDLETKDDVRNYEVVCRVREALDLCNFLLTEDGSIDIIGTPYSHAGIYVPYAIDLMKSETEKRYSYSRRPGTANGEADGVPVLITSKKMDELKHSMDAYKFNCQVLINPTPQDVRNYNRDMIHPIEPKFIPKNLFSVMLIDQAGDNTSGDGDPWAILSLGVETKADGMGMSKVYLKDLIVDQMRRSAAMEAICRMYLVGGIIRKVGVEQVGMSSTEVHIANALKKHGRILSVNHNNLVLLKPAGRTKDGRVVEGLDWPLLNGKIFYSTAIPTAYIDKWKDELDRFPYCSYHVLDALAYLYDILNDPLCNFARRDENNERIAMINKKIPKYASVHMGRRQYETRL